MARLVGYVLFAIGLSIWLVPPAHAAGDSVTLGLPERLLPADPAPAAALDKLAGRVLAAWPCHGPGCPGRPTVVNIALGTDYEILDWFGKGLLDLALVPEVSAYLLRYDGLDLVDLTGGSAAPSGDGDDVRRLERFSEWVWCSARARAPRRWDAAAALGAVPAAPRPACAAAEGGGPGYELQVPSHLHGFVTAVDTAAAWLAPRIGAWGCDAPSRGPRTILENGFWREFLRNTRFTFGGTPAARAGATPIRLAASGPGDRLVLARPAARRLGVGAGTDRPSVALPPAATELWSRSCYDPRTGKTVRSVPGPFRTFLFTEPAFAARTFAFSPRESIDLLGLHKSRGTRVTRPAGVGREPAAELALVLPGGGVKAAYQTTLIERLYREGLVHNAHEATPAGPEAAVGVDYVIGTSGGALLGYFAARLTGRGPWNLETTLWQSCGRGGCRDMESTDIFGYIDMPRYLSALAMLIVFALLLYLMLPAPPAVAAPPPRRWRWRLLLWLMPVLAVLPLLIRLVNGEGGREHIAELEGIAYALVIFLAMFADQCLVFDGADVSARSRLWRRVGIVLCVIGGAAVLVPALLRWRGQSPWLDEALTPPFTFFGRSPSIQEGALVVCLGGLTLLAGIIVWTRQSRGYRLVRVRGFLAGLAVGLMQIVGASLGIIAIVALWPSGLWPFDQLSLLELTSEYWLALALASVVAGLVLLGVRRLRARWRIADAIARGIDYLSGSHPHRGSSRRLARLVFYATLAVVWWNVVLAPGVYGNGLARQFLQDTDSRFLRQHPDAAALRVPLIVTANVLEADGARYFAFLPTAGHCLNVTRRSGYGATWRVFWPTASAGAAGATPCDSAPDEGKREQRQWTDESVRSVVFASGSPYPVFPAHVVRGETGRLVDGGYANNVPIDAAQAVGADEVLIIESSNPLGYEAAPGTETGLLGGVRIHGDLVGDLPRLAAFLYERSQELDRISRRELLVVSLAPRRNERGWPTLVQFTGGVIRRMRTVAESDWNGARRIGMVQSWGRPRFAYTVTVDAGRPVTPR